MRIITCASYYGTGSSAISDYLSEFDNVQSMSDYEFRFAHDPDGISDLEYNLVDNFNRHNSGHSLKRFKKLVDYYSNHFFIKRYEPFFDNQWKKLSYLYIESLVDFSYNGFWQYDFYDNGKFFEFRKKFFDRLLHKTIWKKHPDKHFFPMMKKEKTLAANPSKEKFLECTKNYTRALISAANKNSKEFIMFDQLVASSNIERHIRYFDEIKVFVVDRDPRDLFLLAKYEWNDNHVPKDVETFCKWFLYARSTREKEKLSKDVMFVQFEDLVYKYESTTKQIMEFVGLDPQNHKMVKQVFRPEVSINNTRYWVLFPQYQDEAERIANILPEYLYELG